jgi:hypothetical protein
MVLFTSNRNNPCALAKKGITKKERKNKILYRIIALV